jgi:outer membrane protein assembly factor BamB
MAAGSVRASTPVIWEQASQREFQNGKPTYVSIDSEGYLTLAPTLDPVYSTSEPLIWCIASDARGNVYAGSGNDGKLFKIDPSGRGSVFFDAEELEIRSVVVDAADNLYVATFPNGKIYKLTPAGQASVFFDPASARAREPASSAIQYIWSLALDKAGNLYVGTGDQGQIYKVDRGGQAALLAETGETHVVALALDADGSLMAGTDPNGRIYRVLPSGKVSVVYDSPYQEIHSLFIDPSGMLYAGALNEPRITQRGGVQQPLSPAVPSASASVSSGEIDVGVIEVTASPDGGSAASNLRSPRASGGMVYRIGPDGTIQEWWQSRDDACLALGLDKDGALMIGTGPNGRLYTVRTPGRAATLAQIPESQITAFLRLPSGQTMLAASNVGTVYRMSVQPVREGTFESEIKDTRGLSAWGGVRWRGHRPAGTTVEFFARSGNTDSPDHTWSAWSGPYTDPEGEPLACPAARYIQWKAVLRTKSDAAPRISSVSIAYLPRNVAPAIRGVTVYEPGVYLRESSGDENEEADLPPGIAAQLANRSGGRNRQQTSTGMPAYRKGMRAVAIDADDENDDALTYAVYFRGDQETQWKLLKDRLDRPAYSWDSETLPDGMYLIKAVVSDAPSNPPDLALRGEMESAPFLVDNTAPQVVNLRVERRTLAFSVQDASSPLYKVEYAIDGGVWWVVYPTDGVSDSKTETFEVPLNTLSPGEHTIAIRAKDTSNNVGTGKRVITIP